MGYSCGQNNHSKHHQRAVHIDVFVPYPQPLRCCRCVQNLFIATIFISTIINDDDNGDNGDNDDDDDDDDDFGSLCAS
jgi:hypothetical protein